MEINKFESPFKFVGNRVVELAVKNDFVGLDPADSEMEDTLDSDFQIKNISENEGELCGILHLAVQADAQKEDKRFSISLILEGCFQSKMEDKDGFAKLLALNGTTALYSIARSLILSVSSQSLSGGQILLPMINVFRMHEIKENTKNQTAEKTLPTP